MKLYTAKLSPFAARCRMQIYAKGLDVDFVEYPHAVSKDDIIAMNPMGKIPVLTVDGVVLPESEAICEFLEDSSTGPALRPDDDLERARMRLLSRVADFYVFERLSPLFGHLSRKHRKQEIVDDGLAKIAKGLGTLEHFIDDRGFAIGNSLSLADCSLVPTLFFLNTYLPYFGETEPLQPYPKLHHYWNSIQKNEHALRVIDEIKEGIAEKTAS